MNIRTFLMERWQSTYENTVEYNLSESGVHPLTVEDIGVSPDDLLKQRLFYPPSNGSPRFRGLAASLYKGATDRNVLVTIGGAEANLLCALRLIEPGDEAVLILPNYMQVYGLVEAQSAKVVPVWLKPENKWIPDPDEIAKAVTPKTKLISFSNPNNPTGAAWGRDIIKAIAAAADRHGSWILADEVYQGAERIGDRTPSIWSEYNRVLITQSLSKAYGAPGLRTGWIMGPEDMIEKLWAYADYVKIAPPALSDLLACKVLENRERLLNRTRTLLNRNWPNLSKWLDKNPGVFEYVPPSAGAICMVRYHHKINSTVLAERLRTEKSVLIVSGDQFMMDGYIRLGFGSDEAYVQAGLTRIAELLDSVS
jgi:aspartate/methionine/tyrosine aminotransferase